MTQFCSENINKANEKAQSTMPQNLHYILNWPPDGMTIPKSLKKD